MLAVGLFQLVEGMHSEDERTAERAGGLQAVIDCGKAVERMDLVDEEPCAQIPAPPHLEQGIDGKVHPQRQQRPIEYEIGVGGGDEKDRAFPNVLAHPSLDREALFARLGFGQKAEGVGVGDEGGPDRFRHLRGGWGHHRSGNRALELGMDRLEVRHHQEVGETPIRADAHLEHLDAHLDHECAG